MGLCERWMRERESSLCLPFVCCPLCLLRCSSDFRGLSRVVHVVRSVCFCASLFAWYNHLLITNNALAYLRVTTYSLKSITQHHKCEKYACNWTIVEFEQRLRRTAPRRCDRTVGGEKASADGKRKARSPPAVAPPRKPCIHAMPCLRCPAPMNSSPRGPRGRDP